MIALEVRANRLQMTELPTPRPGRNEALIRVLFSGVCNTDLEIMKGYMNFSGVPGHEFVGIVEECPDQKWLGKRVVGEINCGCGSCTFCQRGLSRHCPERTVLGILGRDGCHARFLCLPIENLHEVPAVVSDQEAVFTEPLAAAIEITEQVHLPPNSSVAIVGDGKLAQLIGQVLCANGLDVTVFGKHPQKLRLLARCGAQTVLASEKPQKRFPVVIECSGVATGLELANQLIEPRGVLVLKSTYHGQFPFNPAQWIIDEISVVGSRCGPFPPALNLLARKKVQVSPLISEIVPAVRAVDAFSLAQKKGMLKVLIDWR